MAPRRRLAALAFALTGVALLVALGVWQLQRRTVKEALIAQVEARAEAPVLPFTEALGLLAAGLDQGLALGDGANPAVYRRARVTGRLLHAHEFHVLTPTREGPAWTVMTPLEIAGGNAADPRLVLVARGVVPDALKDPDRRPLGRVDGEVDIVGRLRESQRRNPFTPGDDPERNRWYTRDVPAMLARLGSTSAGAGGPPERALYVEAEGAPPPGGWPRPNPEASINLTNNHLQYAITWFALAAGFVAVFGVLLRRGGRTTA